MQELEKDSGINMTKGKPLNVMLRFAGPLLLGNALQQVYNIVDSSVAGRFIGMSALASVSNGFLIVMIITSLFSALSVGGTIIVAQFLGRQDFAGIRRAVDAIYFGVSVTFIPLMFIGYWGAPYLLGLFNVPQDILPGAITYVRVIFLGVLGGMGYNVNAGILSGLGDSKSSLKFLSLALLLNLAMDIFFVVSLNLGVFGLTLATVIAQFISWILGIRHITKNYPYIRIHLFKKDVDFSLVRKALSIGVPSSLTSLQFTLGMLFLQSLINSYSMDFIAGVSAADRVNALVFMPINSLAVAVSTFSAQNMGAGDLERVKKGTKIGVVVTVFTSIFLGLVAVLIGRNLMVILFDLTPAASEAAMIVLIRVVLPSFIFGIASILAASFRGAGKVLVPTLSGLIMLWAVRIPLAHWLAAKYGPYSLFFAYPVSWLLQLLINTSYYKWGKWMEKPLLADQEESDNK